MAMTNLVLTGWYRQLQQQLSDTSGLICSFSVMSCSMCAGLRPLWRHDPLTERVSDMIVHAWAFWNYGR